MFSAYYEVMRRKTHSHSVEYKFLNHSRIKHITSFAIADLDIFTLELIFFRVLD